MVAKRKIPDGLQRLNDERKARTHCPQGHRYTRANTRIERSARGTMRHCKKCNLEADRRWRARQ